MLKANPDRKVRETTTASPPFKQHIKIFMEGVKMLISGEKWQVVKNSTRGLS